MPKTRKQQRTAKATAASRARPYQSARVSVASQNSSTESGENMDTKTASQATQTPRSSLPSLLSASSPAATLSAPEPPQYSDRASSSSPMTANSEVPSCVSPSFVPSSPTHSRSFSSLSLSSSHSTPSSFPPSLSPQSVSSCVSSPSLSELTSSSVSPSSSVSLPPQSVSSCVSSPSLFELTSSSVSPSSSVSLPPQSVSSCVSSPSLSELTSSSVSPSSSVLLSPQSVPSCVSSPSLSELTLSSVSPSSRVSMSSSASDTGSSQSPEPPSRAIGLREQVRGAVERCGFNIESLGTVAVSLITECHTDVTVSIPPETSPPRISMSGFGRRKSWLLNYTALSFLMNGQLFAEYHRIANMLGLPPCSNTHWHNIVTWLGDHVGKLAQWSCEQVRQAVINRGDMEKWVTSYDGYYLSRGHYSNNSSATLHDYLTGHIAWFKHRTKRGAGHNWEGTSAGAEADMFDEVLREVKEAGFDIVEMVTDKDSSMNCIYCRYFPEGTITYCSNHNAKTMHVDLQRVKQAKCKCKSEGLRCKRMPETFLNSCKAALKNLMASERVLGNDDPYSAFSEGLMNFHEHYCLDSHTSPWCYHEKEKDGNPYHVKHGFTCKAQTEAFRELLQSMANRPQDYVSTSGRMTTNSVEGFHGLALMYRDKRTDLEHTHYVCKSDMGICHKNLGPVWKVLCCTSMGMPMPVDAVSAVLEEQRVWERERTKKSDKGYLHKRNLQKRAKHARHEREKVFMENLRGLGHSVGEYVGGGQGDREDDARRNDGQEFPTDSGDMEDADADGEYGEYHSGDDENPDADEGQDEQEDSGEPSHPLLFFYDCEATGLSVYEDQLTEIAAKVVGSPLASVSRPSFSSLVHTSKVIPKKVAEKTKITQVLIRGERPLSVVLPEFLQWVSITTREVAEQAGALHFPVLVAHNGFKYDFPFLLAEIERRPRILNPTSLSSIRFADTLPYLRQAKKDGHDALQRVTKFGLDSLYCHFFPGQKYTAHRALPDVEAMEQVFMQTGLVDLLSTLPWRSAREQLHLWRVQQEKRRRTTSLLQSLGKRITASQAGRLDALNLPFTALCDIRSGCAGDEDFQETLKKRGVNSKALRKKLTTIVTKTKPKRA